MVMTRRSWTESKVVYVSIDRYGPTSAERVKQKEKGIPASPNTYVQHQTELKSPAAGVAKREASLGTISARNHELKTR
jgi:hypothetical protein